MKEKNPNKQNLNTNTTTTKNPNKQISKQKKNPKHMHIPGEQLELQDMQSTEIQENTWATRDM